MAKMIVFCADGTWNGPDKDEDGDSLPDPTNVYKLFCGLAGSMCTGSIRQADEQEKELLKADAVVQVAKYIHGVGDTRNPINRLIGGAFGAGMISRIVRGYTFISRNYDPGDSIAIVGFSRGAYTARALAGLIASQGVLVKPLTVDKEDAYRAGAKAWYRYRENACEKTGLLPRLGEVLADLPAFVCQDELENDDFVVIDNIAAVGVWDTVGALGLPHYIRDPKADAFKFADTRLSRKVSKGVHAVALDEQRMDFAPTLWQPAVNVLQVAFPGAHADVGGGYTMTGRESGLSDIALEWMVAQLKGAEVQFSSPIFPGMFADALGVAHQPWRHWPFDAPGRAELRDFSGGWVKGHRSIAQRKGQEVVHEPGDDPSPFAPQNWP